MGSSIWVTKRPQRLMSWATSSMTVITWEPIFIYAHLKETQFIKDNFLPKTLFACCSQGIFLLILPLNWCADSVAIMMLNIWRDSVRFLEADMVCMLLVPSVTDNDERRMQRLGISRSKGIRNLTCWRALVQGPW